MIKMCSLKFDTIKTTLKVYIAKYLHIYTNKYNLKIKWNWKIRQILCNIVYKINFMNRIYVFQNIYVVYILEMTI